MAHNSNLQPLIILIRHPHILTVEAEPLIKALIVTAAYPQASASRSLSVLIAPSASSMYRNWRLLRRAVAAALSTLRTQAEEVVTTRMLAVADGTELEGSTAMGRRTVAHRLRTV